MLLFANILKNCSASVTDSSMHFRSVEERVASSLAWGKASGRSGENHSSLTLHKRNRISQLCFFLSNQSFHTHSACGIFLTDLLFHQTSNKFF